MEITRPSATSSLLLATDGAWARSLRVGQRLTATVVTASDAGPDPLVLRIAGRLVYARTAAPLPQLKPGQTLALKVESLGSPPVLKIQGPAAGADPVGSALRALLPRQGDLGTLLASWVALVRNAGNPAPARDPLLTLVRELVAQLPEARQLGSADGLRRALADSGLFLESRLFQPNGDHSAQRDLKAGLLRLLAILQREATGNRALQTQAEGALARLQLHQLAALPRADATAQWLFHLPIRHGDEAHLLELQINRDGPEGDGSTHPAQARWSVLLRLDLPRLGPMQARIELQGERVTTRLWAEREGTFHRVQEFLPRLHDGLVRAGLEVAGLGCQCGHGPRPSPAYPAAPVLDLEA